MDSLTFHNDIQRTGLEGGLGASSAWSKRIAVNLGAAVRAAPLAVQGWTITRGAHAGHTVDLVIVAASNNQVAAYRENDLYAGTNAPLWGPITLGPPVMAPGSNMLPPIGVCSSGVLDPANGRVFLIAAQADPSNGQAHYFAYSLDIDTGAVLQSAELVDSGAPGRPTFVPATLDQRGGLNLVNGRIYATFADFLAYDAGPYHGWVVGCNANNLLDQWYWSSTTNVLGGGIWGAGGAAAASDGTLYVGIGNATTADATYWGNIAAGQHPGDIGDYFIGVVKLGVVTSGWTGRLAMQDWYQPTDARSLNDNDQDFGSSSPLVLPDIGGRQLVVISAKSGIYLLDRNHLGHWGNELAALTGVFPQESHSAPAYWQSPAGEHLVYFSGGGGPGVACYRLDASASAASLTRVWPAAGAAAATTNEVASSPTVGHGGIPDSALVWVMLTSGDAPAVGRLCAFDARTGTIAYDSDAAAADAVGNVPHYAPVTCFGRSTLVGVDSGFALYGGHVVKTKSEVKDIKDHTKPEIKDHIKIEVKESKEINKREIKEFDKPIFEQNPKLKDAEGLPVQQPGGDPAALLQMASHVDQVQEQLRSFIPPGQRPAVGDTAALDTPTEPQDQAPKT